MDKLHIDLSYFVLSQGVGPGSSFPATPPAQGWGRCDPGRERVVGCVGTAAEAHLA